MTSIELDDDLASNSLNSLLRNHTVYDEEFKKKVIITAEKTSNREAEKIFGISESNIRRWRKLKGEIFGFVPTKKVAKSGTQKVIHLKGKLHARTLDEGKQFKNLILQELRNVKSEPSRSLGIFLKVLFLFILPEKLFTVKQNRNYVRLLL